MDSKKIFMVTKGSGFLQSRRQVSNLRTRGLRRKGLRSGKEGNGRSRLGNQGRIRVRSRIPVNLLQPVP